MIVTTCTVDGHGAGSSHDLRDHIVQIVSSGKSLDYRTWRFHLPDEIPGASRQKSCGNNRLARVG